MKLTTERTRLNESFATVNEFAKGRSQLIQHDCGRHGVASAPPVASPICSTRDSMSSVTEYGCC
jgi:hypothetical protein